jgi:hypothetical protein
MQEKEENLTDDIINLRNEMNIKLDTKVDNVAWKEANDDLDADIKTVCGMVLSLRLDVDARRRKVDEILVTIRHDITAVEMNLEDYKAKVTSDTDQAVNALNGRIDFTNKDLAARQESWHITLNSLSDCSNEVAVVRSDLERNVADIEARLGNDIRQKQQETFEEIGAVEQQVELRSAEALRRLGALDLHMSGVHSGLGEHNCDISKHLTDRSIVEGDSVQRIGEAALCGAEVMFALASMSRLPVFSNEFELAVKDHSDLLHALKHIKYLWNLPQSQLAILILHSLHAWKQIKYFLNWPTSIHGQCDALTLATPDVASIEPVMSTSIRTTIKIAHNVLDPSNHSLFDVCKPLGHYVAAVDEEFDKYSGVEIDSYVAANNIEVAKLV